MTPITTDSQNYTDIASAIRTQLGVQTTYLPSEMAAAIDSISGGEQSGVLVDSQILGKTSGISLPSNSHILRPPMVAMAHVASRDISYIHDNYDPCVVFFNDESIGMYMRVTSNANYITTQFAVEIPASCQVLHLDNCKSQQAAAINTSNKCYLYFTDALGITSYSQGDLSGNILKTIILTDSSKTVSEITSQTDINITSMDSSGNTGDWKDFEVDLSDISAPCYLSVWEYYTHFFVSDIYAE